MTVFEILKIGVIVGITNVVIIAVFTAFIMSKSGMKLYLKWVNKKTEELMKDFEEVMFK